MDLLEYLQLPEETQWDILHDEGIEIATATSIEYDYLLYGLYGFFVEIHIDKLLGTIVFKNTFIEGERLDKYLPSIRL